MTEDHPDDGRDAAFVAYGIANAPRAISRTDFMAAWDRALASRAPLATDELAAQ